LTAIQYPENMLNPKELKDKKKLTYENLADSGIGLTPVTNKEALIIGIPFFYTGKPCKYGHHAKRNTKSGICCACTYLKNQISNPKVNYFQKRESERKKIEKQYKLDFSPLSVKDRQLVLTVYSETADLEQAAHAVKLTLAELNVQIVRCTSLAADLNALERRLRKDGINPRYIPREMNWDDEKRKLLITAYIDTGDIAAARDAVGATASNFNDELESNPEFAHAVEVATPKAERALEEKAIQLALKGNDKLLTLILKAKKPEYKDKVQIDQTTTIKIPEEQMVYRINELLTKYGDVINAEFTQVSDSSDELRSSSLESPAIEPSRQRKALEGPGGTRQPKNSKQVQLHVPGQGSASQEELSEAS
jgi:hypothetical protein